MTYTEKHILDHILKLSKKFISVSSTLANPSGLQEVLNIAKKELEGYFAMEEFESNGIPSLLIHNTNKRTKHFKIVLNAHLDVVPGEKKQFKPFEKNGRLYGRGAYDMKAASAVMILVFKQLAKELHYPIALQLVTDEEIGGFDGAEYQLKKGLQTDFVIAGEGGSSFKIQHQARGIAWIKIKIPGIAAHSAYPWLGKNPILQMHEIVSAIKKAFPVPSDPTWKTTVTIVNVETSNVAFNKVPADCSIYADIRYVPKDSDRILDKIKALLPEGVQLEVLQHTNPAYIPTSNKFVKILKKNTEAVLGREALLTGAYASADIRHYTNLGFSGIEFGPIGANHHSDDDEWVDIKSLEDYYHILKNFLLAIN